MDVLILGATQFIGRSIAVALLDAGHRVSILNRGKSRDELPAGIERLRGDRDEGPSGLSTLDGRRWDVCIDVSGYTPRQVRPSAEHLLTKIDRYVFVSAVSVYGDPVERPVVETHARIPPIAEDVTDVNRETYGRLKVTCENIVQETYGDRCTILRPQIVVGPHDPSGRYSYWVQRVSRGGEMLAPGDGADHLQVIDVRDVARFAVTVVENNLSGAFNIAGPRLTWAEFMKVLGVRNLVWVSAQILRDADVTESELPLFRPEHGERSGLMDVSNDRARAAGLDLTDPHVTLHDTKASIHGTGTDPALSPEREADLIQLAHGQ